MKFEQTLEKRRRLIGPALSLSYQSPLKIVRGQGAYLFDESGRRYLDCVNNVCHVGHCHPRVVEAGARQMAQLNTNTRYLHDLIVEYAERLAGTFPDPLSVCTFVCSGSEANELATRMARTVSGQRDLVVLEGAYHGTTQALIEMSPYKFEGPGGFERPAHVHQVAAPDLYRGPHRGARDGTPAGEAAGSARHVADLARTLGDVERAGRAPAAFFCESALGCAGQVILPPGYLAGAYPLMRATGAVCVADEVQVGFGRVGSHFWAFETQGVVPDIVTLGKPMGNGHPVAAVVTTPEIAAAFDNGMEYFNTFGGNPVSCAIGLAVLDVIADEGLQEHAARVGARLLDSLAGLARKHEWIGDVRGLGLFIGIELVRDRNTLEPAEREATRVVEAMKERGVLLSTDGPLHNVIKIKPPLVLGDEDVDLLLSQLDEVLAAC